MIIIIILNPFSHNHSLKVVRTIDYEEAYKITVEPENKAVAQTTDGYLTTRLHKKYRGGVSSLHALNEIVQVIPGGCGFKRFSPFFKTFNEFIGIYIAAGLSTSIEKMFAPEIQTKADDIGPQVLTMEHLALGFIACLIPLALATAIFLIELSVNSLNSRQKIHPQNMSLMNLDQKGCLMKHVRQSLKNTADRYQLYETAKKH